MLDDYASIVMLVLPLCSLLIRHVSRIRSTPVFRTRDIHVILILIGLLCWLLPFVGGLFVT